LENQRNDARALNVKQELAGLERMMTGELAGKSSHVRQ
jgi:hypothetical protein